MSKNIKSLKCYVLLMCFFSFGHIQAEDNPLVDASATSNAPVIAPIKNKFIFGFNYNFADEVSSSELTYSQNGKSYLGSISINYEKGFGFNTAYLLTNLFDPVSDAVAVIPFKLTVTAFAFLGKS